MDCRSVNLTPTTRLVTVVIEPAHITDINYPMKKITFSHSSLKDFDNCALQYYHKRILKDIPDVKGEAATWGERVHKDFELRMTEGRPLPDYLTHFEPTMNKFLGYEFKCEWKVCLNDELKPTEWMAADAWLRGILDLFIRISPTVAAVLDYKTGKHKDDFDQLKLCALMVFAHEPEVEEVRSGFIWTQSKMVDTEIYYRKDANKLWEDVISKIRRVYRASESDNWPAKPSGLCNWCGFKPQCPYARK